MSEWKDTNEEQRQRYDRLEGAIKHTMEYFKEHLEARTERRGKMLEDIGNFLSSPKQSYCLTRVSSAHKF